MTLLTKITRAFPDANQRLMIQGGRTPVLRLAEGFKLLIWEYLGDFGALGLLERGILAGDSSARRMYRALEKQMLRSGVRVHKEPAGMPMVMLGIELRR